MRLPTSRKVRELGLADEIVSYMPWAQSFSLGGLDAIEPLPVSGTRGGGRTHTSRKGQGILSPPRMPFRHPGISREASALNILMQESHSVLRR